jgi:hypothetical protein
MPSSAALHNMETHSLKHQEILKLFNATGFDFFRETEEGGAVLDLVQSGNPTSPINNYVRYIGERTACYSGALSFYFVTCAMVFNGLGDCSFSK